MALLAAGCSPNPNGGGVTDTGQVVGRVLDQKTQQPVDTATIQVGVQVVRLSPSDKGGFSLQRVPIGSQPVLIASPGYASYSTQVVVRKDQQSDLGLIGLASATGL
jgi:hypothetical protein